MAKTKVKGGFNVKKKDGTLGVTVFKTQAAAQSRSRGPGKKGRKSPARAKKPAAKKPTKRRGTSVAKNTNNKKPPKIGASIQAFKGAQAVAAPVIQSAAASTTIDQFTSDLRSKANLNYAGSLGIEAANQVVDRKIAHGAALSRGSLTAWAAEGVAAFRAFKAQEGRGTRGSAVSVNQSLSLSYRAYNPVNGTIDTSHRNFQEYQFTKIAGAVARRLSTKGPFKRVFAPVKKLLGEMGGAL